MPSSAPGRPRWLAITASMKGKSGAWSTSYIRTFLSEFETGVDRGNVNDCDLFDTSGVRCCRDCPRIGGDPCGKNLTLTRGGVAMTISESLQALAERFGASAS